MTIVVLPSEVYGVTMMQYVCIHDYVYVSQTNLAQQRSVDLLDFMNTTASEAKWCLDCLGWLGWLGRLSWLGWLGLGQWGAELDATNLFGV